MARISDDANGAVSGKMGRAVYYSMYGRMYVRSAMMPRDKNSWSDEQVKVRGRVKQIAALWRQVYKNPVRQIWEQAAQQMSGYNLFLKTNLSAIKIDTGQVNMEFLHLTTGPLSLPRHMNAVPLQEDNRQWQLSWNDDSGYQLSQPSDQLMAIFAHDGKFTDPVATGFKRSDQSGQLHVPEKITNLQGVYLFFASQDGKMYSADQFFGK